VIAEFQTNAPPGVSPLPERAISGPLSDIPVVLETDHIEWVSTDDFVGDGVWLICKAAARATRAADHRVRGQAG
jgi:hypothetical protein